MRKLYEDVAVRRDYTATIIGTTNPGPILYDDEALISRFVFIDVHRSEIDPEIRIPEIREHLFALALQAYQEGFESNIIPVELKPIQYEQADRSVNVDRVLGDSWSEMDCWHLIPTRFKLLEIARYMGLVSDQKQLQRLKYHISLPRFLRGKGFIDKKGKGSAYWWERPADSADEYPLPDKDLSRNELEERNERSMQAYNGVVSSKYTFPPAMITEHTNGESDRLLN